METYPARAKALLPRVDEAALNMVTTFWFPITTKGMLGFDLPGQTPIEKNVHREEGAVSANKYVLRRHVEIILDLRTSVIPK